MIELGWSRVEGKFAHLRSESSSYEHRKTNAGIIVQKCVFCSCLSKVTALMGNREGLAHALHSFNGKEMSERTWY